ncbi:MAG: hypothetical protein LAQ69_05565 [Acidobacteriia bacterium]|nr:hypothetical protein [Terriglobia bacterium]
MRDCFESLAAWWNRRSRFAEEWRFHRDRAISEFESLGLTRREARRIARCRLGRRSRYRREALREIGGDLPGLIDLLPVARLKRSPLLVLCCLVLGTALLLVLNPQRGQLIESLRAALPFGRGLRNQRLIPLTPAGIVPAWFALLVWRVAMAVGAVRLLRDPFLRNCGKLRWYGALGLILSALFGVVAWISIMQFLLASAWSWQRVQSLALILATLAYVLAAAASQRLWWRDVIRRCPSCVEILRMPIVRGSEANVLLRSAEVESICLQGHGTATHDRWGRTFQRGRGLFPAA